MNTPITQKQFNEECRTVDEVKAVQDEFQREQGRWAKERKVQEEATDGKSIHALCIRKDMTAAFVLDGIKQRIAELEQFAVRVATRTQQAVPRTYYISTDEAHQIKDSILAEKVDLSSSSSSDSSSGASDSEGEEDHGQDRSERRRGTSTPTKPTGTPAPQFDQPREAVEAPEDQEPKSAAQSSGAMSIECLTEEIFPGEKSGDTTRPLPSPSETPADSKAGPRPLVLPESGARPKDPKTSEEGARPKEDKPKGTARPEGDGSQERKIPVLARLGPPLGSVPTKGELKGQEPVAPGGNASRPHVVEEAATTTEEPPNKYLHRLWSKIKSESDPRGLAWNMKTEMASRDCRREHDLRPDPRDKRMAAQWLDRLFSWTERGAPNFRVVATMTREEYRYLSGVLEDTKNNRRTQPRWGRVGTSKRSQRKGKR